MEAPSGLQKGVVGGGDEDAEANEDVAVEQSEQQLILADCRLFTLKYPPKTYI